MTTTTGDWIAVRACSNWRIWNTVTKAYHRGTDKTVRVYVGQDAARARADKLNERTDE